MENAVRKSEQSYQDTRELLLQVAERLFAERGLDDVSMRLISREANQKNTSSVHYHFGSREGVISAVLERRMSVINQQRLKMLEGLLKREQEITLQEIVALFVNPLADHIRRGVKDHAYVQFLAQANGSNQINIAELARGRWDQSLDEVKKLARAKLADLPVEIFRLRMNRLIHGVVYLLAEMERELFNGRDENEGLSIDMQISDLIRTQAAALTAGFDKI